MTRDHIDHPNRCLLNPSSKNGHALTILLAREPLSIALEGLAINSAKYPNVFPLSANAFWLAWERINRQVGVKDRRFHDLRNEAISRVFEAGLSVPEVAFTTHLFLKLIRYFFLLYMSCLADAVLFPSYPDFPTFSLHLPMIFNARGCTVDEMKVRNLFSPQAWISSCARGAG